MIAQSFCVIKFSVQFSSVAQSCPTLCNPMNRSQASLSITNSQSSPRLIFIESLMPSSHLILCRPLLLLPPIPPSIRVFSSESTLHMRWPKYWEQIIRARPSRMVSKYYPQYQVSNCNFGDCLHNYICCLPLPFYKVG